MAVERERAVTAVWQGQDYAFCSRGCCDKFLADPQPFLSQQPAPSMSQPVSAAAA